MKRIAVFSTSEIQGYSKNGDIVATDRDGHHIRKGAGLEKALAEGFEVYVVTTRRRSNLGDHDQWWRGLVPADHIFTAPEERMEGDNGDLSSPSTNAPWRALYKALGLSWPTFENRNGGEMGVFWTAARHMLEDHGIVLGMRFDERSRA